MSSHWYVLRVKPHKERAVCQRLQSQGTTVYLPTLKVKPANPRSARQRPYFPGYMFVQADLQALGAHAFAWLPGTRGLVSFGEIPAIVPENLIHDLKQRIARFEARGMDTTRPYQKGDRVRIVKGPFSGYEAIFDVYLSGPDRAQVLLAFLSHYPQPLKLDTASVEKLN